MVTGVSARGGSCSERAVELGAAARARPPRAVLEVPPDRADAAAGRAPAAAVQARHQPRRLPPAARRAPGGRQQRDPRARARVRGRRAVRRLQGHVRSAAGDGSRSRSRRSRAARARARPRPGASRCCSGVGATSGSRTIGIVSGSAADTLHEAAARGPRRVPDRRAARAHHGRRRRTRHDTSWPPATTPRRPSACARWAICWRTDLGSITSSWTSPIRSSRMFSSD